VTLNTLFYRFFMGLFAILLLYGAGMTAVILFGDAPLASKMVSGFATMFSGVLGFGGGYLLGTRGSAPNGTSEPTKAPR
jgi:ribose/xylose/arabinose/galactoside ABC-type transport system permease subunit